MKEVTEHDSAVDLDVVWTTDDPIPDIAEATPTNWMAGGFDMMGRLWMKRLSKDPKLHAWQRIAMYGWGSMRKDGHCPLADGEIGRIVDNPRIRNDKAKEQIDIAVCRGWLADGSNRRCLIMPYDLRYLTTADVSSRCALH